MPNLFGIPAAPAEAWWGGRFFSKGLPYFLSLYVGPLVLGLAAVGAGALPRGPRMALFGLAALGLWYALGARGGLAPLLGRVPLVGSLRFPAKALLLPHLAVAVAAGFGVDRLRGREAGGGACWPARPPAAAALCVAVAALVKAGPASLVAWTGVSTSFWPRLVDVARGDAAAALVLAAAAAAVALAVRRGRLSPGLAVALVVTLAVADLARAGAGLNRAGAPLVLRSPAGDVGAAAPRPRGGPASSPTGSTTAPRSATSWGGEGAS